MRVSDINGDGCQAAASAEAVPRLDSTRLGFEKLCVCRMPTSAVATRSAAARRPREHGRRAPWEHVRERRCVSVSLQVVPPGGSLPPGR